MKVIEEGTDRSAEIHFYVEGSVDPLREYGEYVAADYAVCCYVAVEKGNKPKISGTFRGTTKEIACDAFMDGVHRRSITYEAKDVQHIKKKLDFDSFLYKTESGTINSKMLIAPLNKLTTTKKSELDSRETVGTVELRLYITRQLDVFHDVKDTRYDSPDIDCIVCYNRVPPTYQLDIERNSTPITKTSESAFKRRMRSPRPGREPWVVFRFHYRSEEALDEPDLPVTFDVKNKKLSHSRILPLEPVPPLVADAERERPEKGGSHTPPPFLNGTLERGESLSSKSSTPVQDTPTIKVNLAMKTMTSNLRGIEYLQRRAFEKPSDMVIESLYMAGTEGADSPTSVSTTRGPMAATEAPCTENSLEHESAPSVAVSNRRSPPTMDEASLGQKRPKLLPIPTSPPNEPLKPQNTSFSDVPEAISPENRFFGYRKKLADLRKTWLSKEKELAVIKKEMESCKRCMNEELDLMHQEVQEEENAFTEERKHCSDNIKDDNDSHD
ncbi:hypothetical protein yc1106_07177 [Curvularia clavata]|uniref:Uncharacterized protein n=1 Tax=Curvularia clavata TaxID=95742 RepID=A0A9Q8ZFR3_CURCL|nr:hypothetical protein yc1106_07177 [Curvularia clavata]